MQHNSVWIIYCPSRWVINTSARPLPPPQAPVTMLSLSSLIEKSKWFWFLGQVGQLLISLSFLIILGWSKWNLPVSVNNCAFSSFSEVLLALQRQSCHVTVSWQLWHRLYPGDKCALAQLIGFKDVTYVEKNPKSNFSLEVLEWC